MTAKQARLELERANSWLRQAVENALEMKAAALEIPASLERIADSLQSVAATPIEGDIHLLTPELDVLRSRMRQLERLLDGAAALYCASLAANGAAENASYAAHGGRAAGPVVHQLQLNA